MSRFLATDIFDHHNFICNDCGIDIFDDRGFCDDCLKSLPFNNGKTCKLCGSMLLSDADFCPNCKPKHTFFDKAFSTFDYSGQIVKFIYGLKYGGKKYLANVFARYLYVSYLNFGLTVDLVVPAPLSQESLAKRGYNQSELLAYEFCRLSQLPLKTDCIAKIKDTVQQEKLNNKQRRQNLLGAFKILDKSVFAGKTVLIIDDVKTTGTTINRLAKEIKKCKAKRVYGLTVASARDKTKSS